MYIENNLKLSPFLYEGTYTHCAQLRSMKCAILRQQKYTRTEKLFKFTRNERKKQKTPFGSLITHIIIKTIALLKIFFSVFFYIQRKFIYLFILII